MSAPKSAAQKVAEAEVDHFRNELGPFVVAAEKTRMAMIFMDAADSSHPIIFVNDSFLELTGFQRDEVLGQSFDFLIARGTDADCAEKIRKAFIEGTEGIEVLYRCKDGRVFCSAVLISPVRDNDGQVVQHFASFVDITAHRQEQAHSTMLIDELNHRVKNTLATVQAIVSQGLRNSSDPKLIKEAIETRIFALSRSHDLLTRERWEGAGLRDVVTESLEPFSAVTAREPRRDHGRKYPPHT
jgi:PAS domain S-box-containing protein